MKALILQQPGHLALGTLNEAAPPRDDEALVRVHCVGVCGTDMHAYRGNQPFFSYPRLIGHELGVEVLQVGSAVHHIKVGDRCAVEPYLNCGHCIACRRGRGNCCVNLQVLGVHCEGGLRERFTLPAVKLHRSSSLTYEQLALVETLGIGAHAVQRAQPASGEWALVVGAGPIGLGVMQFARRAGAQVVALDSNPQRLQFCSEHWGVDVTVAAGPKCIEELRHVCDGDLPTVVFDATGHPGSMAASFDYVAAGGRLVFVGLFPGEVSFNDPNFHRKEMTLLATRNALPADFASIIGWMEAGDIDTSSWITHRAPIEEAADHFPCWVAPESGVLKAMIEVAH